MPEITTIEDELGDGRQAPRFILTSDRGLRAEVSAYGATLLHLQLQEASGPTENLVLGLDTIAAYRAPHPYLGSFVGRYANRIADAAFELDGIRYEIDRNHGRHHLHGGSGGFHQQLFASHTYSSEGRVGVEFAMTSRAGDQGFPGEVSVRARYWVGFESDLHFEVEATTDRPTIFATTQHAYFNLAGAGSIRDHTLRVPAEQYVPVDHELIPAGHLASVAGTAFDLRSPRRLHEVIDHIMGGLDHTFQLADAVSHPRLAAELVHPPTGRRLRVFSDAPAIQVYSGNFLDGTLGNRNRRFERHSGLCLEPGVPPDAPHQPWSRLATLLPGTLYSQSIGWRFDTVGLAGDRS